MTKHKHLETKSRPAQRREILALAAVVFVAAILRLVNLGYESLWYDEINITSNASAAHSFSDVLQRVEQFDGATPLHDLLLAGWLRFGTSEFMARFPSFAAGLATVVLIYVLGRRVFNAQIGLLAALLLALSRFHVQYSQEVRYYTLFGMLTLCSIITFLRFIERRTLPRWTMVVVSHALCLYSAYFTAFFVAFEGIYATYLLVRDRVSRTAKRMMMWRTYFALGAAMSLTVLLFLPWYSYATVGEPVTGELHTALDWRWLMSVLRPMTAGSQWSVVVFMVAFVAGLIYCVRSRCHEGVLLALISVLSPFASLALVNRVGSYFAIRYFLFAFPVFLLLVAAGIAGAAELLGVLVKRVIPRHVESACAWTIALILFVPLDAFDLRQYYKAHRTDWKRAAAYLDRNVGADDLVVSMKAFDGAFCLKYYARPELNDQIVDVRDLITWYRGTTDSPHPAVAVPSTVWFVAPAMPSFDPALFDVVSFPRVKVVSRKGPAENWNDVWGLVADYVTKGARVTPYYRERMLSELSSMHGGLGQNKDAYGAAQELVRQNPQRASYQRQLGAVAVKVGELDVAEQAFRKTLELDPTSYAFSQLADLMQGAGRLDEAVEVVKNAIAAKDEPYRRTWLAMIYAKAGRNGLAEETFRSVTAMQPDYPYAHFRFGQFCAAHGRLDEAVAEYRTVLELDPKNNVFNFLVNILLGMGKRDEAIEVVRRAVAAKDEPYRRVCLGMVYSASGKHDLGEQEFLRAVQMQPDYEYAHYRLGQFYAMHGRQDEAVAELETVLRLNPDPERVKAVQAMLKKLRESGVSAQ